MSFVWKRPEGRLRSPLQVTKEVLEVTRDMGLNDFAAVLVDMAIAQESDFWCPANKKDPESLQFEHDSLSDDGRSVAYLQQQNRNTDPNDDVTDWWGPMSQRMSLKGSVREFLERLTDDYMSAVNDPYRASLFIDNVQQSYWNGDANHPGYYGKHWGRAHELVNQAKSGQPEAPVGISGDPVWLEDVLRGALGNRLVVEEGWKERGAGGTMGEIWGVMIHHTGNDNETVRVIRDGVQQPSGWLPGPLSQCLIMRDGTCHLIAVGPCNHAGPGYWKDLNDGNGRAIGFECAYDGDPLRWPDKQIITMRDATAAVVKHLGKRAENAVCGHKEYAKPQGRKVDPGNMSMDWFRAEVNKDIDGFVFPGEGVTTPPPPIQPINYEKEIWDQLRIKWPQLGDRSLVDTVAAIGEKLGVEGCYDVKTQGKPSV